MLWVEAEQCSTLSKQRADAFRWRPWRVTAVGQATSKEEEEEKKNDCYVETCLPPAHIAQELRGFERESDAREHPLSGNHEI